MERDAEEEHRRGQPAGAARQGSEAPARGEARAQHRGERLPFRLKWTSRRTYANIAVARRFLPNEH